MPNSAQSSPVIKIARLIAKPDQAMALRVALQVLEMETAKEAGCVEFQFYQALTDERSFVLLEHFINQNAFSEHMNMSHTKAFFQAALVESVNAVDVPSLGTAKPIKANESSAA